MSFCSELRRCCCCCVTQARVLLLEPFLKIKHREMGQDFFRRYACVAGFMLHPESQGFVEALSTNAYLCSPYPWIIPIWLIKNWELMVWNVWSVPGMSMAKCRAFGPCWRKKTHLVIGTWSPWRLARISFRCLSLSVNFWATNQAWHHCQHIDWWWLVNAEYNAKENAFNALYQFYWFHPCWPS